MLLLLCFLSKIFASTYYNIISGFKFSNGTVVVVDNMQVDIFIFFPDFGNSYSE